MSHHTKITETVIYLYMYGERDSPSRKKTCDHNEVSVLQEVCLLSLSYAFAGACLPLCDQSDCTETLKLCIFPEFLQLN